MAQVQVNEPGVFAHAAYASQLLPEEHSLISGLEGGSTSGGSRDKCADGSWKKAGGRREQAKKEEKERERERDS